jgi:hypothetical protein
VWQDGIAEGKRLAAEAEVVIDKVEGETDAAAPVPDPAIVINTADAGAPPVANPILKSAPNV